MYSVRGATGGSNDGFFLRFNNDSSSTYGQRYFAGDGSNTYTGTVSYGLSTALYLTSITTGTYTANTFTNGDLKILNYSGSTSKSVYANSVNENNSTGSWMSMVSGLWPSSSAINTVTLFSFSGSGFAANSSFSLYGITKGSDGIVTTS